MKQVSICAGGGQACDQAVLEHIGAAAGVLTNDDACRLVVAVTFTQSVVIPAEEATNLISVVGGQVHSGLATEAVGTKIFSHYRYPSIFLYFH